MDKSLLIHKTEITRPEFIKFTEHELKYFVEYKQFMSDIYKIEYCDSFIKCAIQRTKNGVQIIYLDSNYIDIIHKKLLIAYCTFIIAYRVNKNRGFEKVSFLKF